MLASAWKIIRNRLEALDNSGLTDARIKTQLLERPDLREEYLILYDIVNTLVDALQHRFSVLAMSASA